MMRTVAGGNVEVRNDVLHRLGLEPGSLYGMAEDGEMIFGEVGGEVTGVGNIGDATFGSNPLTKKTDGTKIVGPTIKGRTKSNRNARGQPIRGNVKTDPATGWVTGGLPWLN